MDLKESDILGEDIGDHWYYRSKASALMHLLRGVEPVRILDVGAGSGFFSRHLLTHSKVEEAWCVDTSYPADADELLGGKPAHYRRSVGPVNADLVLFMDVLEHVDDDAGLLREYIDKVPTGSRFVVTVPAFRFLWSGHDIFLGHKRRYTLAGLEATVRKAGLCVNRGMYFFALVFPLAVGLRLAAAVARRDAPARSQLSRHHPVVNALLRAVCAAELPCMGINRLAGLSAFCLAQKP